MAANYDLIVLGSGTAGQMPAYGCAKAGWRVAVVDPRPPGGTCANRGCDAKKPYVNAAQAHAAAAALAPHGLGTPPPIDWPALHAFKAGFTDPIPDNTRDSLAKAGIDFHPLHPRFINEQSIELSNGERLTAKHFVIATGLKPRPLDFPGSDLILDSDAFLDLNELPRRIAFVGGGYVSLEFAHAAVRAGVEVQVIQRHGCILKHADHDLSVAAQHASAATGMEIRCDACVGKIERLEGSDSSGGGLRVSCDNTDWSCVVDMVVHGAGRVPNVASLNLEAAGVEVDEQGVVVNAYFQSPGNSRVYAAGDVASPGLELTPVSGVQGKAVRDNLLHGNQQTVDAVIALATPTCVFMAPPLAEIGLTEQRAAERFGEDDLAIAAGDASEWKFFRELGRGHAFYKLIARKSTKRLVGVHLLMPGADELINLFALAMTADLPVSTLSQPLYAYPTLGAHVSYMLPKVGERR